MPSYQPLPQQEEEEEEVPYSQEIFEGEGLLHGYISSTPLTLLFHTLNLLTLGLPSLFSHSYPRLRILATSSPAPLHKATKVLLTLEKESHVCSVDSIFPPGDHHIPEQFLTPPPLLPQNSKSQLLPTQTTPTHRYFIHRDQKFVWSPQQALFTPLNGLPETLTVNQLAEDFKKGISLEKRKALSMVHGDNLMDVEVKSYGKLLVEEVLNPFYLFQLFSLILWCLDEYIYYATCVLLISAISISIALHETKRQSNMLREMATNNNPQLTILTPNGECFVWSSELVPGDVLLIPPSCSSFLIPCDAVLIAGSCIVNESMLTGESTPTQKSALNPSPSSSIIYSPESHRRHTLFSGTEVIQTRYYEGNKVACVVLRTGFNTLKGQLIHSILYPKQLPFKFYKDAIRFVTILFGLATLGMTFSVYLYVSRGAGWWTTMIRVLDVVTIVVPPALPAALTVGTVYAQNRLKRKNIFCISPPRINFCGKLKLMCFDKTGTLTEDGLDFWCVLPTTPSTPPTFLPAVRDVQELGEGSESPLLQALASCHSLTYIQGGLVGDPLDLKMFAWTGWELEEPTGAQDNSKFDLLTPTVVKGVGGVELGIIKEFEFTPQLQRMSVVVRSLTTPKMMTLYCKGAPEKIRALSVPSSIPPQFDSVLDSFTLKGYRVLALGYRLLPHLKWHQVQRVERGVVEGELTFVGFLVMQNSLKSASIPVIRELNGAGVRSVMVTGDNMLTALSVARECGILHTNHKVIIVRVEKEELEFKLADTNHTHTESSSHQPTTRLSHRGDWVGSLDDEDYSFVLTGDTWSKLEELATPSTLQRIVLKGAVYARMTPEQKSELVERLQGLGYVVGMCGDGANDCSALKMAHVGISLSEAEASVAAPFTSKIPDISCVPNLIREGRAALVTSFGIFKYMALYSLVQFISVLLLYYHKTNLADTQFLYFDLGITTSMAIVMGRTEPYPILSPSRPMGSLVSLQNISSILLQLLISSSIQVGGLALLQHQHWFTPLAPSTPDTLITLCWETTTIFSLTSFQYLILALVFSKGPPFRKPAYTNHLFLSVYAFLSGMSLLLALYPPPFLSDFFHLMPIGGEGDWFRLLLLSLPPSNLLLSWAAESGWVGGWLKRVGRVVVKKGVQVPYKVLLKEMHKDPGWPPIK